MAGPGMVPKHPNNRTRSGSGAQNLQFRTVDLPIEVMLADEPPDDLLAPDETWHPATLRWWARWRRSPLAQGLPETDVTELENIAVLHQQFMVTRKQTVAAELRLRMAAFGATPADRMRLRILTADADTKDEKKPQRTSQGAAAKYGDLRLVDPDRKTG